MVKNRVRFLKHPAMHILCKSLRREAFFQFISSLLLLALGIILTFSFFNSSIIIAVLGLGLSIISLKLIFETSECLDHHKNRVYQLLSFEPEQIVWVYSVVTEQMPFGLNFRNFGIMYFKLANGEELSVALPVNKVKLVSKYLNRLLPHATFGFSNDRNKIYQVNPNRLRKQQIT